MSHSIIAGERIYGVDLAKNKFQVHVFSPTVQRILQRTPSRAKFDEFFRDPAKTGG